MWRTRVESWRALREPGKAAWNVWPVEVLRVMDSRPGPADLNSKDTQVTHHEVSRQHTEWALGQFFWHSGMSSGMWAFSVPLLCCRGCGHRLRLVAFLVTR